METLYRQKKSFFVVLRQKSSLIIRKKHRKNFDGKTTNTAGYHRHNFPLPIFEQ